MVRKENKIDYNKYAKLVKKFGQSGEAYLYKEQFIPHNIYKFQPLSKRNEKDIKDSKLRLDTLLNEEVYLSSLANLNDPFDGKTYYWKLKMERAVEEAIRQANCEMRICSFTVNDYQSMPMWAYYANNHKGFCVKYEVASSEILGRLFPVQYVEKRLLVDNLLIELSKVHSLIGNDTNIRVELHKLFLSNAIKHVSWQSENEIRMIDFQEKVKIKPSEIYIGKDCEYKSELIEIGKRISCNTVEMKMADDCNSDFWLDLGC